MTTFTLRSERGCVDSLARELKRDVVEVWNRSGIVNSVRGVLWENRPENDSRPLGSSQHRKWKASSWEAKCKHSEFARRLPEAEKKPKWPEPKRSAISNVVPLAKQGFNIVWFGHDSLLIHSGFRTPSQIGHAELSFSSVRDASPKA
jgi:hypothetical protein